MLPRESILSISDEQGEFPLAFNLRQLLLYDSNLMRSQRIRS